MGLHDEDISKEEILKQGLATPEEYEILEKYTLALFKRGTEIAAERGLIQRLRKVFRLYWLENENLF